jgi:acetyltransferase-like isoleucine patch superfamily enzyme
MVICLYGMRAAFILCPLRFSWLASRDTESRIFYRREAMSHERLISALKNRLLQFFAHFSPGARTVRVWLHRGRGVKMGRNVWIGYDVVLDTSRPDLIAIGDNTIISVRAVLIAHFREKEGITIDENVFVGPGAIILPGVTIGRGAVITAGSVVAASVPAQTVVQGNPARPVATSDATLVADKTTLSQFYRSLRPIRQAEQTKRVN